MDVGDTLFISGSITPDEMNFVGCTGYLPDGDGAADTTSIMFDDFAPGATIESLNDFFSITAIMEHSFLGDLTIDITCPNNTKVQLENPGGGGVFLGEPIDDNFETPPGFTAIILIDESHCSSHCYSDRGWLAIDVFTCGKTNPKLVMNYIEDQIRSDYPSLKCTYRKNHKRFHF